VDGVDEPDELVAKSEELVEKPEELGLVVAEEDVELVGETAEDRSLEDEDEMRVKMELDVIPRLLESEVDDDAEELELELLVDDPGMVVLMGLLDEESEKSDEPEELLVDVGTKLVEVLLEVRLLVLKLSELLDRSELLEVAELLEATELLEVIELLEAIELLEVTELLEATGLLEVTELLEVIELLEVTELLELFGLAELLAKLRDEDSELNGDAIELSLVEVGTELALKPTAEVGIADDVLEILGENGEEVCDTVDRVVSDERDEESADDMGDSVE
jgi:hypothetical protein